MKKIIGIFVCTLLIATVITVTGQFDISIKNDTNKINPLANGDKWMKSFGGEDDEFGSCVQQTSEGGYIVFGI
ncbi:MAG: hypothetical protein KAR55_02020, partial [Thermoplasmatales archaeon]|nr:hypothetical protein [Thermoplasmatales archaeon]